MLDVVDVLEVLGSDADLVGAPSASREAMLRHAGVGPALRSALLGGDARALHGLLRVPKNVCCLINPGEAEEDEEEDEEETPDEEHEDDGEDNAAPRQAPDPRRR